MITRNTFSAAAMLALGLLLAACAAESEPEITAGQTATPTAAPTSNQPPAASNQPLAAGPKPLPDLGPAPDFTNEVWLNTDRPLSLESLQGQVVLVEFWTFG